MLRIYRHLTFGPNWIWTSKVGIMESGEGRRIFRCVPSPHAALPSHGGLVVSLLSGPSRCWTSPSRQSPLSLSGFESGWWFPAAGTSPEPLHPPLWLSQTLSIIC